MKRRKKMHDLRTSCQLPTARHHRRVDDNEATQLMLEALFDIKAPCYEIHDAVVEPEDDDEETEEDT